jgi:hypothetical protein
VMNSSRLFYERVNHFVHFSVVPRKFQFHGQLFAPLQWS